MRILPELMLPKQRLAQGFLRYGIQRGLTGGEVIGALQRQGLWYRAEEFGKDWAWWRETLERSSRARFIRRDLVIGEEYYADTPWFTKAKYGSVVRVDYYDPATGRRGSQHVTVLHRHLEAGVWVDDEYAALTRREVEEEAEAAFQEGLYVPGARIIGAVRVQGWRSVR